MIFTGLLFLVSFPLYLAARYAPGNLWWLSAALFINGLAIAPLLVAGNSTIEKSVPDAQVTEALGWSLSALIVGNAVPAFFTGKIIDTYGARSAFLIPALCMAAALLIMVVYQRTWRNP